MILHQRTPFDWKIAKCLRRPVYFCFLLLLLYLMDIYIYIIIIIIITHIYIYIYIYILFNYGHMMPIYPLPSIFPALDGAPPSLFPAQRFGAELKSMDDKGCFDNVSSAALINQ